jgi:hypothetical protein
LQALYNHDPQEIDGSPRKKFSRVAIIFIVLAVLSIGLIYDVYSSTLGNSSTQTTSSTASTILTTNNIGSFCYGKMGNTETTPKGTSNPPIKYVENFGLVFTRNVSEIEYNVTALAQNDSYGVGPSYLANGLTSSGL